MGEESIGCRKIPIHPNEEDKKLLKNWLGVARWTYNKCVEMDRMYNEPGIKNFIYSYERVGLLRYDVIQNQETWVKVVPNAVRDYVVRRFLANKKAALTNLRRKNINHFKMQFQSKKRLKSETIKIPHREWTRAYATKNSVIFDVLTRLNPSSNVFEMKSDFEIQHTWTGKWYLITPIKIPSQEIDENQVNSVVAIDPGVRTFATCYTPDGYSIEIAPGDRFRLFRLCIYADRIQSLLSTCGGRLKYKCRLAYRRLYARIHNLVDDLHRRIIGWLCRSFKVIIVPPYETSSMVKRAGRRLRNKTTRQMLTWSFYRFKERLKTTAQLFGTKILSVDESYTSQTCGVCGKLTKTSKKWYTCKSCLYESDRDINGARNILIRTLSQL